jgi:carboxypeptidase C (cathepsin A)
MIFLACAWCLPCLGLEVVAGSPPPLKELAVESHSEAVIAGKRLPYRVIAGTLVIKDDQGKDKAAISYTAYFLKGAEPLSKRPISFCFNGGPGAGSVWLNLGFLGPKSISTDGLTFLSPPYRLEDNPDSLLDQTDLVFIDPVPSGFSSWPSGQDPQSLYQVEEDVKAMADAVRRLTSLYQRWDSPKFFVGESYGGMRVIKMGNKLHDEGYYLNGLILISPALDLQTIILEKGNELPYVFYIPSFAAAAWYHKDPCEESLQEVLKRAEAFALKNYSVALLEGCRIEEAVWNDQVRELSQLTSLPSSWIERANIRIKPRRFVRELLRDQERILGWFDARVTGSEDPGNEIYGGYDPSFEAVYGVMTAAFSQYLLKDLKWPEPKDYKALVPLRQWNWGKANQYASAIEELEDLMIQNPKLKIFVASGIYDFAVPYFAVEYSLSHLDVAPAEHCRILFQRYPAGHMMYFDRAIRQNLKKDISKLFIE